MILSFTHVIMIAGYRGLHDLDLELAVRKVGEQCEASDRIS